MDILIGDIATATAEFAFKSLAGGNPTFVGGTNAVIDFPYFDVSTAGVVTLQGAQTADITRQSNNALTLTPGGTGVLALSSANTGAAAMTLTTTAGGIDITSSGAAAGEDIDITTNASINLTSTEGDTAGIVLTSTNGGIDLTTTGAASGEDIDISSSASLNLTGAEAVANAIYLNASDAAGGIDIGTQRGDGPSQIRCADLLSIGQSGGRTATRDMSYIPRLRWFHEEAGLLWDPRPWDNARVGWYRFSLPVGAREFSLPVIGDARAWVDGESVAVSSGRVVLRSASPNTRDVIVRLKQQPGRYGGAAFYGPVAVRCEPAEVALDDWAKYGLADFSGLGIYRQRVVLPEMPDGNSIELDLGQVFVSAAVKVNNKVIGVRLARPFRYDITHAAKPGANTIEVEVANTVANHFRSEAPTRYVYPGQDQAGLVRSDTKNRTSHS